MNILLFGAAGLLGRHLAKELTQHGHQTTALTHPEADITDAHCLDKLFSQQKWDAVINTAAICSFDLCEHEPETTGRVNLAAPLDLAARCRSTGAKFVQYSSDYVFDGQLQRPLTEEDAPAPLSVYGHQKVAMERGIRESNPDALVLRISWLYGFGGKTFMSLLPSLLASKDTLDVAAGKTGRCLYAPDAALWSRRLLESDQSGLFNVANDGDTSWEEFTHTCLSAMKTAGLPTRCRSIRERPYESLGPNWTKRPRHSSLDLSKVSTALPPGPRPWQEALTDFLRTHPQ